MKKVTNFMNNKKTMIWILVFLILVEAVVGLGVRPAKTEIDFEPGAEKEISFWIVNNDQKDLELLIYPDDELAPYFGFEEREVTLRAEQANQKVDFQIQLPEELEPGMRLGKIVVQERAPSIKVRGGFLSARLVIVHKVWVKVPYPDKYIEAKLDFQEEENEFNISSEVTNLGKKDIDKLKTVFGVYDNEKEVVSAETKEESLKITKSKTFSTLVDKAKLRYGEFDVLASIIYDDGVLELSKILQIGKPEIEIIDFDRYFIINRINEFNIELKNKWNKKLKNIYALIFVFKNNKKIDELKTISFDLGGEEFKRVTAYFDARDKELGDYDFELVVYHGNQTSQKRFKGAVITEEEYDKLMGENDFFVYLIYLGIGMIVLLMVLVGVLIFFFVKNHSTKVE